MAKNKAKQNKEFGVGSIIALVIAGLVLIGILAGVVLLEKTLESPLNCKEIQPVHSEGDWPWDFFGRNNAKAETPVLWPSHAKS